MPAMAPAVRRQPWRGQARVPRHGVLTSVSGGPGDGAYTVPGTAPVSPPPHPMAEM